MKRRTLLFALPFAATLLGAAPAVPDVTAKAIVSNYATTCAAVLDPTDAKFDKMAALLAPDFVLTDITSAKHDRSFVVPLIKQELTTFKASSCKNDPQSMTAAAADTVVVLTNQLVDGTVVMQGSNHPFSELEKTQDTWTQRNGSWVMTASKTLHVTVNVDGKTVQDVGQ